MNKIGMIITQEGPLEMFRLHFDTVVFSIPISVSSDNDTINNIFRGVRHISLIKGEWKFFRGGDNRTAHEITDGLVDSDTVNKIGKMVNRIGNSILEGAIEINRLLWGKIEAKTIDMEEV